MEEEIMDTTNKIMDLLDKLNPWANDAETVCWELQEEFNIDFKKSFAFVIQWMQTRN